MSSGWGCPNEVKGMCRKVSGHACDPGMKGCVLAGRFTFSNEAKNRPAKPGKAKKTFACPPDGSGTG